MSSVNGDAATATRGGVRAEPLVRLGRWATENRASLFVFAATAVIGLVRIAAWPSALKQDQWAYTLAGRVIADLHRPFLVATYTDTTPKPLATLLGVIVSPIPPERGFAVVTVFATALLAAGTFAYGRRVGGSLGAVIGVAALAFLPSLPAALYGGEVDLLAAAFVVLSFVSGPRARVALMILLGLLRPLSWPLAGIAAFLAARGSLARRLSLGFAGMATAPVIWLLSDAVVYGSVMATYRANERINSHVVPESFVGALGRVVRGVYHGTGPLLCAIGLIGLAVAVSRRPWKKDPFPTCVFVGYLLALLITWMRMKYNTRYALPVVALWPLFAAHLGALVPLPRRVRSAVLPAAVCAVAIVAVSARQMSFASPAVRNAKMTRLAFDSAPAVNRALACGPVLSNVGLGKALYIASQLAVETNHSIGDFRYPPNHTHGATAEIIGPNAGHRKEHIRLLTRKGWVPHPIPLGQLWVSPRCRAG